jgi:hypothetical protein
MTISTSGVFSQFTHELDWAIVVRGINSVLMAASKQSTAYTHVVDGRICPAEIINRPCQTRMQILIPVDEEHRMKAFVVLRNPHNHPAHPHTKPSVKDTRKLETAIQAAGLTGLTVQKLLNGTVEFTPSLYIINNSTSKTAPSTVMAYGGGHVADNSPAYVNKHKVCDAITIAADEFNSNIFFNCTIYVLSSLKIP